MAVDSRAVVAKIAGVVAEIKGSAPNVGEIMTKDLIADLRLDSLDMINVLFRLEEAFEVSIPEPDIDSRRLTNVGNLVEYIVAAKGV